MTLERLALIAALCMAVSGLAVYVVTPPRSAPPAPLAEASPRTATADEELEPAPFPREVAPAPSDTGPAPSGTPSALPAPSASASVVPPSSASAAPSVDPLRAAASSTLAALAVTEAPGMSKEGRGVTGNLRQGETLVRSFQLTPGRCYTALAVGVGVVEIDASLVLASPLPGLPPVLAYDTTTGPTASLGGKGRCYKWSAPLPTPAKLVITARTGTGFAAGQLYVR